MRNKITRKKFLEKQKSSIQFTLFLAKSLATVAVSVAILAGAVYAGSLTPASAPGAVGYTLADVYNRLDTNATAGTHSFAPGASPAGSLYSVDQIYAKIPTIDAAKILEGTTYLGIAGTIAIKDSVIGNNGELAISLPAGYYSGKTATAQDSNLISDNIKAGVSIFGVDGNSNVVDTSSGTAAVGDILSGKIAFAAGGSLTGTYNAGNLTADNVKNGIAFGVSSTGELLPSGGTATVDQVCNGASFYGDSQTDWNLQAGGLVIDPGTVSASSTYCGVQGTMVADPAYGDNDPAYVLNTAGNPGTYDPNTCSTSFDTSNLSEGTVKNGTLFGNGQTGAYPSSGYLLPSAGAVADLAGNGTIITSSNGAVEWWKSDGTYQSAALDFPAAGSVCSNATVNGSGGTLAIDANKMLDTATYCGIAGNIATQTLSAASDTVGAGYYAATTLHGVDADLASGNIKSGINIFGIDGNSNVMDTSGGTAGAGDILSGKIAFAGGAQITGNVSAGSNVAGTNGSLVFNIPDGLYSGSKTCTASDSNLLAANIKSGTTIFGVLGTMAAGRSLLPDTGQTASYTGTFGEDHDYTSANSAVCDRAASGADASFTNNHDGTISDNCTNLMWKSCGEGQTYGDGTPPTCGGSISTMDWEAALAQCEGLDYAGHTDWRLPNINELLSIVNYSTYSPAINAYYFPSTASNYYWASSTGAINTTGAWYVDFYYGYTDSYGKTNSYRVRCVREQ